MYVDTKQVSLTSDGGRMYWMLNAGAFDAVIGYEKRHPQRLRYRAGSGELEITCHDYWLANGTHYLPKYMLVKSLSGETYRVDIGSLRHFNEKEDEMVKRLQKWDQIIRGREVQDPR